ncbi:MAG: hypothetical protein ABH986_05640 [archaeon]
MKSFVHSLLESHFSFSAQQNSYELHSNSITVLFDSKSCFDSEIPFSSFKSYSEL